MRAIALFAFRDDFDRHWPDICRARKLAADGDDEDIPTDVTVDDITLLKDATDEKDWYMQYRQAEEALKAKRASLAGAMPADAGAVAAASGGDAAGARSRVTIPREGWKWQSARKLLPTTFNVTRSTVREKYWQVRRKIFGVPSFSKGFVEAGKDENDALIFCLRKARAQHLAILGEPCPFMFVNGALDISDIAGSHAD